MNNMDFARADAWAMRGASYASGEKPHVGDRVEAKGGERMTVAGLYAEQGIALCRAETGGVYRVPFSDLTKVER